jgi:hypothetical protein
MTKSPPKVVRSYRLVFRRRWRIFRIQNWRIPLPNGLELRLLGYWLACLAALAALGRLPLLDVTLGAAPISLRLVALPIAAAWALSRWEIDGRAPHRALGGLGGWWLRPHVLAGARACPPPGAEFAPLGQLTLGPDLSGSEYPRGRLSGPVRVLLRYPVQVQPDGRLGRRGGGRAEAAAASRRWRLRPASRVPLHKGKTLEVPRGRSVVFETGLE